MIEAATVALALSVFYTLMTALNMTIFRAPPDGVSRNDRPRVSLLIPARNEAAGIEAAVDAALASRGVELEVVVLDDASEDDTAERVARRAESDPRVRLIHGAGLEAGWNGKQYACWQLAAAAEHDLLIFIDADVRVDREALALTCGYMRRYDLDLASGFPRELTVGAGETLLVPMIHVLLLGYLPLAFSRLISSPALAAGCGQLIAVSRYAYEASGGHAAIRTTMHDGLRLPRMVRRAGFNTDVFDASDMARCHMYAGLKEAWNGFSKNAVEGMATPIALPVWTILLAGGHVAPFVLLLTALIAGATSAVWLSAAAVTCIWSTRGALALRYRQAAIGVLLHPIAVIVMLALQWRALLKAGRGRATVWRGRTYLG